MNPLTTENGVLAVRPTTPPAAATSSLDPYAPIEKRSLWTSDSMRSRGYSVRVADPQQPAGWRECGVMSADYLVIPNADARDLAREICDRSGLRFNEERTFFDGKRYALDLVAKEDMLVETKVGDFVGLGMRVENSYDGSRRISASLFAFRLACLNGMLAPKLFKQVTFKHTRASAGWEEDAGRALTMLGTARHGLERFAEAARNLAAMRLPASRLREVRQTVLPKMPVTLWGKVMDRFLLHEELDGYGLLNAATNVLWHDPKATGATFEHNEYATTQLVGYALGA